MHAVVDCHEFVAGLEHLRLRPLFHARIRRVEDRVLATLLNEAALRTSKNQSTLVALCTGLPAKAVASRRRDTVALEHASTAKVKLLRLDIVAVVTVAVDAL